MRDARLLDLDELADVVDACQATWTLVGAGERDAVEKREATVLAVEAAYDHAWGAADLDALLECLSHDAVLVNPRGQVAVGHNAIREALGTFLASEAKGSEHRSTVSRITFVREDARRHEPRVYRWSGEVRLRRERQPSFVMEPQRSELRPITPAPVATAVSTQLSSSFPVGAIPARRRRMAVASPPPPQSQTRHHDESSPPRLR